MVHFLKQMSASLKHNVRTQGICIPECVLNKSSIAGLYCTSGGWNEVYSSGAQCRMTQYNLLYNSYICSSSQIVMALPSMMLPFQSAAQLKRGKCCFLANLLKNLKSVTQYELYYQKIQ